MFKISIGFLDKAEPFLKVEEGFLSIKIPLKFDNLQSKCKAKKLGTFPNFNKFKE